MSDSVTAPRQLKLFQLENPLTLRFGSEFFRALPASPGVYFFHDGGGRLLYIGQSANLRARVGSYRHVTPEKNPKRTLRLVARVARIEWRLCASAAEAIECERLMLLEHRPPFNRAGVWQGPPWWLALEAREGGLRLELSRQPEAGRLGPFAPAFRHALGCVVRGLWRVSFPGHRLGDYPHRLIAPLMPLTLRLAVPETALEVLTACLGGCYEGLLAALDALPPPPSLIEQEYWLAEREELARHAAKAARLRLVVDATRTPALVPTAQAPAPAPAPAQLALW